MHEISRAQAVEIVKAYAAAMGAAMDDVLPAVRADYPTMAAGAQLARRHGATSIEEGMREEARQRVLRNRWADVTSRGAQ